MRLLISLFKGRRQLPGLDDTGSFCFREYGSLCAGSREAIAARSAQKRSGRPFTNWRARPKIRDDFQLRGMMTVIKPPALTLYFLTVASQRHEPQATLEQAVEAYEETAPRKIQK